MSLKTSNSLARAGAGQARTAIEEITIIFFSFIHFFPSSLESCLTDNRKIQLRVRVHNISPQISFETVGIQNYYNVTKKFIEKNYTAKALRNTREQ